MSAPEQAVSAEFAELLAEFRKNAEEWGACNGDAWLARLGESEAKIERYVAKLEAQNEEMFRHMPYEGWGV